MNIGPWQLLIVAVIILVLFGRGRISEMMGDFGKGIKSFKRGMTEDDTSREAAKEPARLEQRGGGVPPVAPGATTAETTTPPKEEREG